MLDNHVAQTFSDNLTCNVRVKNSKLQFKEWFNAIKGLSLAKI